MGKNEQAKQQQRALGPAEVFKYHAHPKKCSSDGELKTLAAIRSVLVGEIYS